jgi:hypothetical protein
MNDQSYDIQVPLNNITNTSGRICLLNIPYEANLTNTSISYTTHKFAKSVYYTAMKYVDMFDSNNQTIRSTFNILGFTTVNYKNGSGNINTFISSTPIPENIIPYYNILRHHVANSRNTNDLIYNSELNYIKCYLTLLSNQYNISITNITFCKAMVPPNGISIYVDYDYKIKEDPRMLEIYTTDSSVFSTSSKPYNIVELGKGLVAIQFSG